MEIDQNVTRTFKYLGGELCTVVTYRLETSSDALLDGLLVRLPVLHFQHSISR